MSDQGDEDFDEVEGLDELEGLEGDELHAALAQHAQTRGALTAYRTCLALCGDKKAPAAARGQAASNVLRVGGFYAKRESDERDKDFHEMRPEELRKMLAQAQRDLAAREAKLKSSKDTLLIGSIFD